MRFPASKKAHSPKLPSSHERLDRGPQVSNNWPAPTGAPIPAADPLLPAVPVPARHHKRRLAPIIPTTIALALLTTVGGMAAVRQARQQGVSTTPSQATFAPAANAMSSGSSTVATTAFTAPGATMANSVPASVATPVAPVDPGVSSVPASGASLPPTAAAPQVMAKPLPPGGTFAGGRPPQFVLVSFDGAADQSILEYWEAVSTKAKAHLTFFLSTVYLLAKENRALYKGPRHNPGESNIGFAQNGDQPAKDWLRTIVTGLQDAQRQGHEVGMHFGGHWCGANGVRSWNAADWALDLDQSDALANGVDKNNGLAPPVGSPYLSPPVGARTPCLEGNLALLEPVLAERGYRYDASKTRNLNEWPTLGHGLWQFGFPSIVVEGEKTALLAVDYSINYNLVPNHGDADPKRAAQIERLVYNGYMDAFNQVYHGNRAPFELSNHFTHMSHDAYNNAAEKFLTSVCQRTEVYCVSYREAVDWLDAHKGDLGSYQKGQFPVLTKNAG
jgi:hypothetical protein